MSNTPYLDCLPDNMKAAILAETRQVIADESKTDEKAAAKSDIEAWAKRANADDNFIKQTTSPKP